MLRRVFVTTPSTLSCVSTTHQILHFLLWLQPGRSCGRVLAIWWSAPLAYVDYQCACKLW